MKPVSPSAASAARTMEDEERRKKLEAGRAKLAEYRQRKAQSDGQKKTKKKQKKQKGSDPEEGGVRREEGGVRREEGGVQREEGGVQRGEDGDRKGAPTSEFSFSRTLRSGETVKHDQTYTIEPESEVSTTAEDYSSEDEELEASVSPLEDELQQAESPGRLQAVEDELAAKSLTVEELSRELEDIRAVFGAEGVQQLQDFEAALKQRDGIITQLTANLQQARTEKDEVMREFLQLTEQSQKLQLQFQQLQAGESLRSSSISSAAADLLQSRQQVLLYQQQLEERDVQVRAHLLQLKERDAEVKGLQTQLDERDIEVKGLQQNLQEKDTQVKGLQEKLLQTTELQLKLSQIETVTRESEESIGLSLQEKNLQIEEQERLLAQLQTQLRQSEQHLTEVRRDAEASLAQRLQEKDLRIAEQERLTSEQQQLLSQLQDNLRASESHLNEVGEQLAAKIRELEACEVELQTSRQKERLSSGEIQQLMGTVEDLQKRCHHQGAEQGDAARKADLLRAELDEMYGQQIVQMKQELLARHTEEMARVRDQHSAEMDKISEHLRAKLTQSTGEVNALSARVVELQQKLQENQVLRERAEQDLAQVSKERLSLQNRVQELGEDLRLTKQSKVMEKSQTEVQQELQATIRDLQAKLAAAHEASSEMEAKHESEITNYQIKLEMLEREKDAVLDRMAESQEAELERLRTQLLFSHEEELSRLHDDLQHESQMNMENLRDELRQVRNGYEAERGILDAERASLLQEIVLLKDDLSRALENSRVDELVSQLKELQLEIQELRRKESERTKSEDETSSDKTKLDNLESENKVLKETKAAAEEELKSVKEDREGLLRKIESLATDNQKAEKVAEELKAEIERQKSTFSFAEKNFEVNYQELREELQEQTQQYETRIQRLQEKLQTVQQTDDLEISEEKVKEGDEGTLVEKDTTELMEKLQRVQLEKVDLEETVQQKEVELQKMKADLKKMELDKAELLDHNRAELQRLVKKLEKREAELQRVEMEKAELMKQLEDKVSEKEGDVGEEKEDELCSLRKKVGVITLRNKALEKELEDLKHRQVEEEGICSVQDHHLQITALEQELQALHTSFRSAERDRLAGLRQEEQSLAEEVHEGREEVEAEPVEGLLAPPLAPAGGEGGPATGADTRSRSRSAADTQITDVQSDGETEAHSVTRPLSMEGSDHEECRLQMEALRISLRQIHAAQLELLRENLAQGTASGDDDPKLRRFRDGVSEDHGPLDQMVCDDQTAKSDDIPLLYQLPAAAAGERSPGQELEKVLRLEFQEQQELQEQQHQQEIQHLRSYYSQQNLEREERYRAEIHLLENRLQELTGTEPIYSFPAVSLPGQQGADLLQLDDLDSVRTENEDGTRDTENLQRQREEDIAKVIVQMSVEFAQQTELARLGRQQDSNPEPERLQEEIRERNQEIMLLRNKLEVLEQGAAEQRQEMEEEEESQTEKIRPSMQSSATQTQTDRGQEDEDRDTMKEDVMSQMSSQDVESSSDYITTERNLLRKANEKLRQVLVDVLKTTAATEETIGRHVEALLESSSRGQQSATRDFSSESFHGSEKTADDASVFSAETETDEGLELSQMMLGVGLLSEGAELQLEREEYLSSISSRLQSAVEKLLFTITETTSQLEHARVTQTELMREKFRHGEEIAELMRKQEELQERLVEEASSRQHLALQLHSAEGLIDGYTGERRALEEQVRERAELQLQLEQELQVTSSRLQELEHERQNLHHQRELLHRQQEAMRDEAGGRELHLLEETEKLMQEKVEVQRQAEKEHSELLQQVKQLEAELEEQVGRFAELEETHRVESSDLTQQISALEKQLENNRRFLDEQAMDREHERDVFQQEINKLEQQLKNPQKTPPSSDQHHREVEELSSALREKADWCSELLLRAEQLQREVEERNEEIEKLETRVRELEQLIANTEPLTATVREEDSKQYASMAGGEDATLESLLQTEREALDRKEKEIVNLEEQLEQFREELQNKSEEVQQLHMQLEIQRKEIYTQQQELLAQSNLHTEMEQKSELVLELEAQVEYLRGEQERLKRDSEEEVEQLNSVIEKLQQELSHIEHKQSPEEEDHHNEEEYDELKQKMDSVVKELDTIKTDHSTLLVKYETLQQELSQNQSPVDEKDLHGEEEYSELKQKLDAVVKELDTLKTDHSSLLVKFESLQQELPHSEHKRSLEDEDHHGEEEYNELKQKMDTVLKELDTLKTEHSILLVKYESLQQELSQNQSPADEKDLHGEEEYSELKQKLDAVVKELDALKADRSSLLVKNESLQQELSQNQRPEDEKDPHGKEEYSELKQKMDSVLKELDTLNTDHSSLLVNYKSLQQELSHAKHKQSPEDGHGEEEFDELKQKMDSVVKELDTLKTDHSSLLIKYESLQQDLSQKQTPEDMEDHHGVEEYNELKQKMCEVVKELDTLKTDHSSLLVKYEGLQQELSHTEHKQSPADEKDRHGEEEYDELKQKMDVVLKELDTLKTDHSSLLVKYESLQQEAVEQGAEQEQESNRWKAALDEALRERTASLVVAQAQVQALQESAGSRMGDLTQRIAELEDSVEEKEAELHSCRLQVEKAQEDAETLHLKVSQLEEKLREKVAAVLVSQAQLEAVQVQTKELHSEEATLDQAITELLGSRADLEGEGLTVARVQKTRPPGKVGFLTEKLQVLEQGLSSLQKDQELQKELLSSSEEEVQEYERRLTTLMEILNQMRSKPAHAPAQVFGVGDSQVEDALAELQKVRDEASAANEELTSSRELGRNLQEEIQLKEAVIQQLEVDLQQALERGSEVSAVLQDLQEVRDEAAFSKEELISCRELSHHLQEQIQEREMTIALLKDQLHRASGEVESSELLQELQEIRTEAAATKEELNSYIEQNHKLQEQIQVRDVSIAEMMEELQQLRTALSKSTEDRQTQSPPPSLQSPPPSLQSPPPSLQSSSQSRKKAGKHSDEKGKGSSVTKDKPALSRKNSNSQSSNGSAPPSSSRVDAGTQVEVSVEQVEQVDAGTQVEQVEVSEDLEEVIGEYTERIGQMQELHAAEIMDMENRHISESDILKRENQRLEQECSALRATISNLRTNEAVRLDHPTSSQLRDGYASDSSSDWSQRTGFELPHLQGEFRSTPEGARRDESDVLPDRIKTLLREVHQEGMQVLSLSELPVPEAELPAAQVPLQAWRKEREALLDTVESLKTLITQLQTSSQTSTDSQTQDWRADLLGAVQQVFLRERQVLKVTLLTHLDLLDTRDAVIHLNQLQRLLTEQDAGHQEALSSLQSAERRSLLAELTHLRSQLQHLQQETHLTQQPHPVASTGMPGDWPTAGVEVQGVGERGETGPVLEELKNELTQIKLDLEISLKNQNKYLQELDTLREEVCVKSSEVDSLSERLVEEQRRARELQWVMEREKNRAERREEGEREEVEDLKLALEEHQGRVSDLSSLLEEERKSSAQLRDQTAGEISKHTGINTELQVKLDAQRLQVGELSSALQRERELNAQLLKQLQHPSSDSQRPLQAISAQGAEQAEAGCSQVEEGVRSVESLLQSLQDQLTEKQSSLVDLMGQLEQQKLQEVQGKRVWEQERGDLTRDLQGARETLEKLQRRAQELQAQRDGERERGSRLERERDGLQRRLIDLTDRTQRDNQQTQWGAEGQVVDRTRDWVLQQKTEDSRTQTSSSTTVPDVAGQSAGQPAVPNNLDSVVSRLQLIASKINSMTSTTADRLPVEGPDRESLSWLHSNVQDVLSLLQKVPPAPPAVPESAALLTGGSSSALTERLLRQNAELTGFVSRLTEEKNELRNQLLRLEEELRRQRHLSAHSSSRSGSEGQELVLFSGEREAWSRERARLEKSLRQAESELSRLQGELRTDTLRDLSVPDADNVALKRIYGKYLRAESFRKALIYQKKYLLLLLGGFMECEEATLSFIARMGGRPTYAPLDSLGQRRRAFSRFRSAARVSIALSRMRFLVQRWKKAAGGPISSPIINRNGLGQTAGIEGRNDSPYLQPSVEQYGERRGMNRTGRDSPRTGHCAHHRYGTGIGEGGGGGVLCSHLQNYDPDRALTDYITRLEALQRRLGSVQSGSSSYAQLHFGIRR